MTFQADLSRFSRGVGLSLDTTVRRAVLGMTREIVRMTPVGDPTFWKFEAPPGYTGGQARSNWFWGVQQVTTIDPTRDKTGNPSIIRAAQFASALKAGGVVYLTNNLPYIMGLEMGAGSPRQAPQGMARITVAKWQSIVNKAVPR